LVGGYNVVTCRKGGWILSLVIGVLVLGGCDRLVQTVSYASYAQAEAAGFVGLGWIPEFVPETAGQIDEAHNLDTNQYCARVALAGSDIEALHADLTAAGFRPYVGELPPPPGLALFQGCPFSLVDIPAGSQAFRTTLGSLYVVFDEFNDLLFYWSTSN